jgi:hypothetical protein
VSKRDSFLLRLSPEMMDALRHWSEDEFRSMNAQIEMVLTEALRKAGRLKTECETTGKGKKGKENSPKSK